MSRVQSSSSASTVGIKDTAGNSLTSTAGALDVNVVGTGGNFNPTFVYNEVTNVSVGIETTIAMYTVTSLNGAFLQYIASSGQNIGEIRIYVNGAVIDKNYLYYTYYNVAFDYKTEVTSSPGRSLVTGDIVYVKALNNSTTSCNYNAKIQILEAV